MRDILSHLIEYLRMTESMNKNSEPRERTEKSFRSSGRKVPSFFSSFPSPHHAHRSKQKEKVEKEELEDIEREREFHLFLLGVYFFFNLLSFLLPRGGVGG